ncbi:MAG: EamA family transporter [Rhodospirillales bacterium]|nr:EamA family transporter [Rhodospirillales bacterium]MBO6786142.1 EamA family transporter [Rhodospirillales bacterium]
MKPTDVILAILVAVTWGVAFIATEFALQSFTPSQLTGFRFVLAALPLFFVRKPDIPWTLLIALGLFLFTGQFMFLFFSYKAGMPPGLASVATHTQALFTIIIAALVLREIPTTKQISAVAIAFIGLGLVFASVGGELTYLGLCLTLSGALSWAVGNNILKRLGHVDMLALMIWLSIVPPLPAFAVSWLFGDSFDLIATFQNASMISLLSLGYLGIVSTTVAFAIWGRLLNTYPAVMVTPFALFAPIAGVLASYLVFGESFGTLRGAGMILIMIGVAGTVLLGPKREKSKGKDLS